MSSKLYYIEKASEIAENSNKSMTHGAILVSGHQIVSSAYNDTKHAEINVIEKYISSLKGSTI